MTSSTPVSYWL